MYRLVPCCWIGILFFLVSSTANAQEPDPQEVYMGVLNDISLFNDSIFEYIDSLKALGGENEWKARYILVAALSYRNDEKERAKSEANACIEHFQENGDTLSWIRILRFATYIELDLNDYRSAIQRLNQAINLAIAIKDSSEMAYFDGELGYLYMSVLKDMEQAHLHLDRSYDIAVSGQHWERASRASCYLMEYYWETHDTLRSRASAERALEYSSKLDSNTIEYYDGYLTMSYFLLSNGEYEEAIKHGNILVTKGQELFDEDVLTNGLLVLSEALLGLGRYKDAYKASKEAVEISERLGDISGLEPSYELHWRICEALGKTSEALEALKNYNEYLSLYSEQSALVSMVRGLYKGDLEREKVEKEKVELTLALAKENSKFKSLLLLSVIGLLIALLIYSYIVYKRNKREREYNRTLEASNEVILRQKLSLEMNLDELKKDLEEKQREADSYYFAQSAIQIKFSRIILLESSNNYVLIHVEGRPNPLLERVKMKDLVEHFPSNLFVRIHRSYYINLNHIISRPSKYVVKMSNDIVLNVSRGYVDELGDRFLKQGAV